MGNRLRLFLFILTAVRVGGDTAPGRKTVLAYSSAVTLDDAMEQAIQQVDDRGWRQVELQAVKELSPDPTLEPDPIASEAIAKAVTEGFAQISY